MSSNPAFSVPLRRFSPWPVLPVCLLACALPTGLVAQTVVFSGTVSTLGSGFAKPTAIAVDGSGNVYVTDYGNNAVYELLAVGGRIPASPTIKTLGSGFSEPFGVAVDGSGNVYVANQGNSSVYEMLAVGGSIPASPTIVKVASGFSELAGMAMDSSGNVYVVNEGTNAVEEMLAVGGSIPVSPTIRTLGSGFSNPQGVTVDGSGNVYVADTGNSAVKEMLAIGGSIPVSPTILTLGSGFSEPTGVAVDASGNVYVVDQISNTAYEMLAVDGSIPASPTIETLTNGFNKPDDVALDGRGNVYVADSGNSAVKEIPSTGTNFGPENLAGTSAAVSLQFSFTAAGTGIRAEALTEGTPGLDFADAGTGSCTTNGTAHAYLVGDTCTVDVTFTPRYAGLRRGALLVLNAEDGNVLASVLIFGIGIGPQIGFVSGAQMEVGSSGSEVIADVAVDGAGDTFFSEMYGEQVVEVPADGGPQTIVADGLDQPWEIAVDGAGDIFIANSLSKNVQKVPPRRGFQTTVGSGLQEPFGVAVDGAGNVFISDSYNNNVVEEPGDGGAQITVASGLNFPMGIAVDDAGNLFIANRNGKVVDEVVPGNSMPLLWGSGLSGPEGVAVDAAGDVFVADSGNTSLVELPAGGGAHILLGNSAFNSPAGVAVDAAGDLFVADTGNTRVVELPYSLPPSLTFSSSGASQTVTLENIGNLPLALPGIAQGTNPVISNGSFVLNATAATACKVVTASASTPGTLGPGQTCDLTITFSPSKGGTQSGTLVLTDNSLNASPTGFSSQTISLSGTANASLPDITWASPAAIAFGTALSAAQLNATANVGGSFTYNPAVGTVLGVGTHTLSVTFNPTNTTSFTTASTTVTLTVNKATPAITWAAPPAIAYGTDLSATQLDATSSVAGSFVYDPPAGTGLTAGSQTLSVIFTPTNTADYATTNGSVQLTVNKDSQTISFTQPTSPVAFPVSPILLSATGGSSGNPVTFSLVSGPGTLSGTNDDVLTVSGPGTIVVAANQAGNANYATATQVNRSVVVTGQLAVLTSPTPSSTVAGPNVTFTWTAPTGTSGYALWIGNTGVGSNNLYSTGVHTTTSAVVADLPTTGGTIYVRLWTSFGGSLASADYTYAAATRAAMTSPTPNGTLAGPSVTFSWSIATGAPTGYAVWIGSTGVGSNNLYSTGVHTNTSASVTGLPTNGGTIYLRVWTSFNGTLTFTDYTYTAAKQAVITAPSPGSVLAGANVTFSWSTATGSPAGYALWIGSTGVGSNNLYATGVHATTSAAVIGLPTNGETIYLRLWTSYNGTLVYTDYTYTAE